MFGTRSAAESPQVAADTRRGLRESNFAAQSFVHPAEERVLLSRRIAARFRAVVVDPSADGAGGDAYPDDDLLDEHDLDGGEQPIRGRWRRYRRSWGDTDDRPRRDRQAERTVPNFEGKRHSYRNRNGE